MSNAALGVVAGERIKVASRQSSASVVLPPAGFKSCVFVPCSGPALTERVILFQYMCRGDEKNTSVPCFLNTSESALVCSAGGAGGICNTQYLNHQTGNMKSLGDSTE